MKISDMEVTYRYHYGSDLEVVNAARVSFSKESDWEYFGKDADGSYDFKQLKESDIRLINYLAKHNHWTPFGHVGATLRIKAPIFVARQLVKHQVGLVWNEVSRRYVDDEPEFWLPQTLRKRAENIKQGSSNETVALVTEHGRHPYMELSYAVGEAFKVYKNLLNDGVAPEQARMVLPQNAMTEWIWTGSLAAWARVVKLRTDSHAQLETQEVAQKINAIINDLFPVSMKALMEY